MAHGCMGVRCIERIVRMCAEENAPAHARV